MLNLNHVEQGLWGWLNSLESICTAIDAVYIYGLADESGEVRYVGKALNPYNRLRRHITEVKRGGKHTYKKAWMRKCIAEGKVIHVILLEMVPTSNWPEAECWWIAFFRSIGARLVNQTDGGEGAINNLLGRERSAEHCKKMSAARKGKPWPKGRRPNPPGTGAKIAAALRGRKVPPEIVERVAAQNRGRVPWNKGIKLPFTPEVRAREAERRSKLSSWNKGMKMPPEHCNMLSEVQKQRWERRRNAQPRPS